MSQLSSQVAQLQSSQGGGQTTTSNSGQTTTTTTTGGRAGERLFDHLSSVAWIS